MWKIPGTNGGKRSMPTITVTAAPRNYGFGFSDIGFLDTWTPVWRHERSYTYTSNFTKIASLTKSASALKPAAWN